MTSPDKPPLLYDLDSYLQCTGGVIVIGVEHRDLLVLRVPRLTTVDAPDLIKM